MEMNKDIFEGKWEELKGQMKKTWGKLSDNDMKEIEGNRQVLCGKLQKAYGYSQEEAEKQMKEFRSRFH